MCMAHLNETWGNTSVLPGIGSHMDFSTLDCRQNNPLFIILLSRPNQSKIVVADKALIAATALSWVAIRK